MSDTREIEARLREQVVKGFNAEMRLREEAADALAAMRWIPVAERLPDGDGDVLCVSISETFHVVTAATVRQSYTAGVAISEDCWVAHWMPLPAAPKE